MSQWSLRLTKAVLPDDFARRRRQLLNHMHPGSIAVIPGAVQHRRNNDIFFPVSPRQRFLLSDWFSRTRRTLGANPSDESKVRPSCFVGKETRFWSAAMV